MKQIASAVAALALLGVGGFAAAKGLGPTKHTEPVTTEFVTTYTVYQVGTGTWTAP